MEVRIESPFPEHALPRVWTWIEAFRWRVADDFGPKSLDEFVAHVRREPLTWGVFRSTAHNGPPDGGLCAPDGAWELGGLITARPLSPVVVESHCLFKRSFWVHETTLEALRRVYGEVFAQGYERIFGLVFADAAQMIGTLRRIGFQKEGRLRAHTRRNGKAVDVAVLGLLKGEFDDVVATCGVERAGRGAGKHGGGADQQIHVVQQRIDDDPQPPGIAA